MKYIKKFSQLADYEQFVGGGDYVIPNVCFVEETNGIVIGTKAKSMFPIYLTKDGNGEVGVNLFKYLQNKISNAEMYEFSSTEEVYINNVKILSVSGLSGTKDMFVMHCESYVADVVYLNNDGSLHLMYV